MKEILIQLISAVKCQTKDSRIYVDISTYVFDKGATLNYNYKEHILYQSSF